MPDASIELSSLAAPDCLFRSFLRINGRSTETHISNADMHRSERVEMTQMCVVMHSHGSP